MSTCFAVARRRPWNSGTINVVYCHSSQSLRPPWASMYCYVYANLACGVTAVIGLGGPPRRAPPYVIWTLSSWQWRLRHEWIQGGFTVTSPSCLRRWQKPKAKPGRRTVSALACWLYASLRVHERPLAVTAQAGQSPRAAERPSCRHPAVMRDVA